MMKATNLILCGFMGCGKTTVGPLLAQALGMEFLDADAYIEERVGRTIPQIFAAWGEAGFRDREHQALVELAGRKGLVLSTGGGAMAFARNVAVLQKMGTVLYLNPGFEECYRRIAGSDRPLVRRNSKEELARLYGERHRIYRSAADLELAVDGPPAQWVEAALRQLENLLPQ